MKRVLASLILAAILFSTALAETLRAGEEKILVVASHPLLAGITEAVGGPYVSVSSLVPLGADPHEYEPGVEDLRRAGSADLILVDLVGHIPTSDRIYELYKEKSLVLLEEVERRGWRPATLQGGAPLYHEFFLDKGAIVLGIEVISKRLAQIFEARNRTDVAQKILERGEALEEAVAFSYARGEEILKSLGVSTALYSPSLLYLARSLGLNISAVMTPDPEVEPLPRAFESLGASGPVCLILAPELEHVDPGRLRSSLGRGVEIADISRALDILERGGLASFPLETAISIRSACLGGLREGSSTSAEASRESRALQGFFAAIPWFLAGLVLGASVTLLAWRARRGVD